jgi:hypothetical protein
LQCAIDSEFGLIGYQIMYKMPTCEEMMVLVEKINAKIAKFSKVSSRSMLEEAPKEPTKWLIMPDNSSSNPREFNEALSKAGMRAVLLSNEELNQCLNNARAIWPYIA